MFFFFSIEVRCTSILDLCINLLSIQKINNGENYTMTEEKHTIEILHPTIVKGKSIIEVRVYDDGTNGVFIIPQGSTPVDTGVSIEIENKKLSIKCRIRKKLLKYTPEEVIRQKVLNWLIDELNYPEEQIGVEVGIIMGTTVHSKPADIVVFNDESKEQHWITIEVKQPSRKDGREQLISYMNPTAATFGYWSDGIDEFFLLRSGANDFSKPILRIPRKGETLTDIDEPLTRKKLIPVKDLHGVFKDMEHEILAHQSVETFNEIFKVVFAKLLDERVNLYNDDAEAQFRLGLTENPVDAIKSVKKLFEAAKKKWKDVYDPSEKIQLNDENVAYCIKALQKYHLIRSGDVLGVAFELLVNQEMKGEMGQFFTPRQVVQMMVKMMNPKIDESVCDPAVGSGGFLIYSMRSVFDFIDNRWSDADDRAEQRKDYAQEFLIGMDNDPRLVRVAKAYMIMENDGRSGVFCVDGLDYKAWDKRLKEMVLGRDLKNSEMVPSSLVNERVDDDGVDIILSNPPFAGAIKTPTTLSQYQLSKDPNGKAKKGVVRAVLFLERCIDMLKPGGRMGIVLPQGLFNNITDQNIRDFVDKKARILAVVGLHPFTFKPFTLAKTSVLFIEKWKNDNYLDDYPIFTAVSMKPGKDNLGTPIYLDDQQTVDTDMDEIAEEFILWSKNENLGLH